MVLKKFDEKKNNQNAKFTESDRYRNGDKCVITGITCAGSDSKIDCHNCNVPTRILLEKMLNGTMKNNNPKTKSVYTKPSEEEIEDALSYNDYPAAAADLLDKCGFFDELFSDVDYDTNGISWEDACDAIRKVFEPYLKEEAGPDAILNRYLRKYGKENKDWRTEHKEDSSTTYLYIKPKS